MNNVNPLLNQGYYFLKRLSDKDYSLIMSLVEGHYKYILEKHDFTITQNTSVTNYMSISDQFQHALVWTKTNRLLNEARVRAFKTLQLFDELKFLMGNFSISDEEGLGYPNVYFRLARPNEPTDVGPPHADSWFWNLAGKSTGERFKILIPLWPVEGEPAFKFIPSSHLRKDLYSYKGVMRNGQIKPEIIEPILEDDYIYHGQSAGYPILFHDDLIHGGNLSLKSLRISIEFTGIRGA